MRIINQVALTAKIVVLATLTYFSSTVLVAQPSASTKQVLVDISHGQRFYNDPAAMSGKDPALIERIKYMTGALAKNAAANNAKTEFLSQKITPQALSRCDLLFIHMPSAQYDADEVNAIQQYLRKGGSLFIVMEVDYWSTLAQSNVNDIVKPFGILFKSDHPDGNSSGGYADKSDVTTARFSIPYHGARMLEGGTPFCYSNHSKDNPFGVYKKLPGGGKIIAMGEGMVSLYMTSWQGVTNYQCAEFMNDVVGWLLK